MRFIILASLQIYSNAITCECRESKELHHWARLLRASFTLLHRYVPLLICCRALYIGMATWDTLASSCTVRRVLFEMAHAHTPLTVRAYLDAGQIRAFHRNSSQPGQQANDGSADVRREHCMCAKLTWPRSKRCVGAPSKDLALLSPHILLFVRLPQCRLLENHAMKHHDSHKHILAMERGACMAAIHTFESLVRVKS